MEEHRLLQAPKAFFPIFDIWDLTADKQVLVLSGVSLDRRRPCQSLAE